MSDWQNTNSVSGATYKCPYCGRVVGPRDCYDRYARGGREQTGRIFICPTCLQPTFFDKDGEQYPGTTMGEDVSGIHDKEVAAMFLEARRCSSVGAYTSCIMACRKILMNVAVHQKADQNKNFLEYVNYLESKGYIPPNGREWVDEIRKRGNIATHEIKLMTAQDASLVLDFVTMLLRFVYEMPSKLPKKKHTAPSAASAVK